MILLPPGDPIINNGLLFLKIIVGAIDDLGLLFGSILLATLFPFFSF